jgi:hypothetical protein
MILPQKHIHLSESMFGLGGIIISLIEEKTSVDDLWEKYKQSYEKNSSFRHGFDSFILTLDYLFLIGAIELDDSGCIYIEAY